MTTDLRFEEYLKVFRGRVRDARLVDPESLDEVAPISPDETAFTEVFLETLEDIGQLSGLEIVHFEKRLGRTNAKINAFGVSEIDGRVDLAVTICAGGEETDLSKTAAGEIGALVRKAVHAFRAARDPVHEEMEPASAAFDLMEYLHRVNDQIGTIRVIVLIDGIAGGVPIFEQPDDLPEVQINVWDLERLFRADSSGLSYESIIIDFEEHFGERLPCLQADANEEDHSCCLTIIPGIWLHDLYHRYGASLLELNVRSFLQARGKVNRGIRDTIRDNPGHFLAYNNGISATVEEMDVVTEADGSKAIRSVKGLQIVNGGQTVASIHRAKDRDHTDLCRVLVQAKITVVAPEHLDSLVPFISRYANTQNRVSETDFSSNHPFHVKMQKLSMQIWAPGETCLWFYERARGQWEVARIREGTTPAKRRAFDQKLPRNQKVDKTLAAKAINAWKELPHIVSLGGQKNFIHFMATLEELGDNWEPDDQYYRDVIAKVIIFKRAEKIARQIGFSGYRANATCYMVSMLAYRTAGRVDLDAIWMNQDVSDALEVTMRSWMPRIHEEIIVSAGDRNVTEWCKKKECWAHIQSLPLGFENGLEGELAEGLPLPTVGEFRARRTDSPRELTPEERDRQALIMRYGTDEWKEIVEWARDSDEASDFHIKLAGTLLGYAAGGWRQIPSPKQTKHMKELIERWEQQKEVEPV